MNRKFVDSHRSKGLTRSVKIGLLRPWRRDKQGLYPISTAGFTLIEVILVMATFAIIFALSAPIYQAFQVRTDLDVSVDIFTQSILRAQTRAINMEDDSDWGVNIVTSSDKIQNIILFQGSSFSGRDTSFDEVFSAASSIEATGDTELVFTKFTGELTAVSGTVTFTAPQIGSIQKVVTINKKGKITVTE